MNGLREDCRAKDPSCGHDKASHFSEVVDGKRVWLTCLCRGCECKRYVAPEEGKGKAP